MSQALRPNLKVSFSEESPLRKLLVQDQAWYGTKKLLLLKPTPKCICATLKKKSALFPSMIFLLAYIMLI